MRQENEEYLVLPEENNLRRLSLKEIFLSCQDHGFACAIYQLPKKQVKHLIIDLSAGSMLDKLHLSDLGKGFIFHPFSTDHHQIIFIERSIHIIEYQDSKKIELIHSSIGIDELYKILRRNKVTKNEKPIFNHNSTERVEAHNGEFIKLINKAIDEIKNDKLQKIVLSRFKNIELPVRFNSFDFFEALSQQYNNAFVYLAFIPDVGSWIGATPESLIEIDKNRQFRTVALAATQAVSEDIDLEDTTWSQKDIEEQAMVSRFIINCFKNIRLREFDEIGPRTHLSGNIVHLKTDYKVDMDKVGFPKLDSIMLNLLHPTSAVCGMPKDAAKSFIFDNEKFDREYFSGFLGPVHMQNETNIFVNLRCMKILNDKARLYAGAGIIVNSNPEKEWNETELKMLTLLKVFRELY